MTGVGIVSRMVAALGKNAIPNKMIPIAYPTLRAATPVRLMSDTHEGV